MISRRSLSGVAALALLATSPGERASTGQVVGIDPGSAFARGKVLTRTPDHNRAVQAAVGIHDLLRVELTPNGAYNTREFGKQSPHESVVKGRAYPAVLMTTGESDPRVADTTATLTWFES